MLQKFKIYRDIDTVYASRILFALQDTGAFNSINISKSGELVVETNTLVNAEKLQELLVKFTDLYIVNKETETNNLKLEK